MNKLFKEKIICSSCNEEFYVSISPNLPYQYRYCSFCGRFLVVSVTTYYNDEVGTDVFISNVEVVDD